MHEVLTTKQMYKADRLAIAAGTSGIDLMENAGVAVVEVINEHWPDAHNVAVLCGPGNNGGDGYIVARLLAGQGCNVQLVNVLPKQELEGDAAIAAVRFQGEINVLPVENLAANDLIVDAMFGAGLARDISGDIALLIKQINSASTPVLSIDLPSGIDGDSGEIKGCAVAADHSVIFFRRKPGHLLLPGKTNCGEVTLKDIAIPEQVLTTIKPNLFTNHPDLWRAELIGEKPDQHKYTRGHVLSVSGGQGKTGAARLAARGALRAGAGLVSVACPPDALAEVAAQITAIMIKVFAGPGELDMLLQDNRLNSVVIGPGIGIGSETIDCIQIVLQSGAKTVIDADGLTSFANSAKGSDLFAAIKAAPQGDVVLTPHQGEFDRLFGETTGSKLERARKAAKQSGAVIVFKGPDTVIASPDRTAAINNTAPPGLATAGSGDVLAGIIAGLMAQGLDGFNAACAGVWMHGQAANLFGPGLIAEDLPEMLPKVWSKLL